MFAHVLSRFLSQTLSDFITHYLKANKFIRITLKKARVPEPSGYYSSSNCPPGNVASHTSPSPSSPKPVIHRATMSHS